ncbi:MAG: NADH-quinone oxidoreductase subunit H [Desulfurococcaceae archaeon]|nr:NADH-quinone oxidoreductase subunit H [Desulfurococcaceae archaeon]
MNLSTLISIPISILLYIFLPPLLDGVERKVKADIQSRIGPPTILQTWYDILKLISKEVVLSMNPRYVVLTLSLSLTMLISLAVTISYSISLLNLDMYIVITVLILLLAIHSLYLTLYIFSSNPFSIVGTFRIATIDILNEAGLVAFAILTAVSISISRASPRDYLLIAIALTALAIAVYVSQRRLPYDLHEAEPELASGAIIEFSGAVLGFYIYSHLLERYILASIPMIFVAYLMSSTLYLNPVIAMLLIHILASSIYLLYAVISALIGRSRVNLAVKTINFIYFLAIAIWLGVYILWNP